MAKLPDGYRVYEVEVRKVQYATVPVIAQSEEEARQYIEDNGVDSSCLVEDSDNEWREWETTGDENVWDSGDRFEPYECQNGDDFEDDEQEEDCDE